MSTNKSPRGERASQVYMQRLEQSISEEMRSELENVVATVETRVQGAIFV